MNATIFRPDDCSQMSQASTESRIILLNHARWAVPVLSGFTAILLFLSANITLRGQPPRSASPPENAIGIWVGKGSSFRYDGDTVSLYLFRRHPWEEGPDDSIYRLKAKWKGNILCYLGPYGRWFKLAKFVDGRFVGDNETLKIADAGDRNAQELAKDAPVWTYPRLAEENRPRQMTLEWGADAKRSQPVKPAVVLAEDPNGAFEIDGQPAGSAYVAWSPDGKRLVSFTYSWDPVEEKHIGYAKIWDAVTGRSEGRLEGLPALIWDAAFSPDCRQLALAGDDGIVRVWDPLTRKELSQSL